MKDGNEILKAHLAICEKALKSFSDVLEIEENEIVRDAAIQRFEYNFDLAWKAIKRFAEKQGLGANSPREALKTAFKLALIKDESLWLDMLNDRNRTTHTYNQKVAEEIFRCLKKYCSAISGLLEEIKKKERAQK
jgi:nucleotidyltransferase substrate binding protein (TIGR01987 family)